MGPKFWLLKSMKHEKICHMKGLWTKKTTRQNSRKITADRGEVAQRLHVRSSAKKSFQSNPKKVCHQLKGKERKKSYSGRLLTVSEGRQ